MLSFIYTYSLQQPSCIMAAMVLLRCYQHHRCYDHIRAATVKFFKVTFALKVTLTIYLFYNLCRFALVLHTNILTNIILSSFKVTSTIYLFYNLYRFALELSTNILTMIILSSFKVTFTIYLFYNLCRCILELTYTRYKHINMILLCILQGALYYIFILHSLSISPCCTDLH